MLTLREPITRGTQEKPDLVQGIACASALTGRVLLDAAAYLTWGITGELDDMEGVEDAGCVLELVKRWRSCCPLEGIQPPIRTPARKSFPRLASQFSCTVPDPPGTRSNKWAVGRSFPRVVHDASELVGPGGVGLGGATRARRLPAPACLRSGWGHQMRLGRGGLMWDHRVFHVVASYRANPAMVAPSKRNCRIAQRIARVPRRARGAHTEWSCSLKVAIWQVRSWHIQRCLNHRNLAGTPAQGASITSTTTRPWP